MAIRMLLPLLLLALSALASAEVTFPLPDDCPTSCGDITIAYPFGIMDGCFRPGFNLVCDTTNSTQSPKLFLSDGTTQVTRTGEFYLTIRAPSQVFDMSGRDSHTTRTRKMSWSPGDAAPYVVEDVLQSVVVVGCDVRASLIDGETNQTVGACTTVCIDQEMTDGLCGGVGCCQISFPPNTRSYKIRVTVSNATPTAQPSAIFANSTAVKVFAADVYGYNYDFKRQELYGTENLGGGLDASLKWGIRDEPNCEIAQKDKSSYACVSKHSTCSNATTPGHGYNCYCSYDSPGNPYIPHGCKADSKCKGGICSNLVLGLVVGISIGAGCLLLGTSAIFINRKWKKIRAKKQREKYFDENHGLLLQRLISSNEDLAERTKIFSLQEMEKATDNFDVARILGRGGHGTVYKGILSDQRVVAIKKSKIEVKGEIDQFVNEVAILSRTNHRNIVRLFGCCLECEVPLLVYEFISNGTLYDQIHSREADAPSLSWDSRLRIATEAAGALSYLHSAAFISIFHRDVKSSNILLDENLTAKVSDFGASRSVPVNETHVVTAVQGTYGYLDPEYYYTGQLTEKSDVYSFGVILLELLTGKKPILDANVAGEDRNLSINFVHAVKEKRHFDLMEAAVLREGAKEELDEIAELAAMCVSMESQARPSMKEVEYKLQVMRRRRRRRKKQDELTHRGKEIGESLLRVPSSTWHDAVLTNSSMNLVIDDSSVTYNSDMMSSLNVPR